MAFKPKRLTDPTGKLPDVVAETAADYSNFRFRDGYKVSDNQGPIEDVDSTSTPARKGNGAAKSEQGKATDAQGNSVPTA